MQVFVNTDAHSPQRHGQAEHLEAQVRATLDRFGVQVTRVDAHLSDADGHAKAGPDTIHCTLEAKVAGCGPVVVKEHADNPHLAIQGAVRKLERAVATALDKHAPRRRETPPVAAQGDDAVGDLPG
jgi:ribosome-associated translation inhibitor RaiA